MNMMKNRVHTLHEKITRFSQQAGRPDNDVALLAVSKTRSANEVSQAYECGLTRFGENYLQEALDKQVELTDLPLEWHFIGPIQSNKTRSIAENFDWVHSLDRAKIAQRLSHQRPAELPPLQVCIQVNIDDENTKSGVHPDELFALADIIKELPQLHLRGLMCIPAPADTLEAQRQPLRQLRALYDELNSQGHALDTLSMGMSDDLEAAIYEGSTLVRIGTALFGPRV